MATLQPTDYVYVEILDLNHIITLNGEINVILVVASKNQEMVTENGIQTESWLKLQK